MPKKRKGAAAENKNEAPPAKTIKGEEKIASDQETSILLRVLSEDSYEEAICNLLTDIAYKDAEAFWDLVIEAILKTTRMELSQRRSERPDDEVEDLADLKLIGEAQKRFGPFFKCLLILYLKRRHGRIEVALTLDDT